MNDDLFDMDLDTGEIIEKDYDAEEDKGAPKEKILNVGYGKADVNTKDLIITSPNVFVPNAYDYLDPEGKRVSSGYFSHSALNTYRRCQRLFYYKYVEKIRKPQAAVKMWGGSAMHEVIEKMLTFKIEDPNFNKAVKDTYINNVAVSGGGTVQPFSLEQVNAIMPKGLPFSNESMKQDFKVAYADMSRSYTEANARSINEGNGPLPEANWGARVDSEEEFHVKYLNAVDMYIQKEFPLVNPVSVEDLMIYHFPLDTGGTVPIVGFLDLIEKADFMSEYHKEVKDDGELDPDTKKYAMNVINSIDPGELIITDHKCGMAKNYEQARTEQQLTLYSMAKGIPNVAFDSVKLGTTGGKRADRAKPAVIKKIFAKRTDFDYEELTKDFNSIIKGISSGIYDRSGAGNSMVCSPTLCEGYEKCFGKQK